MKSFILAIIFLVAVGIATGKPYKPDLGCNFGCTQQYEPVCGSDGKTYGNACMLQLASCKNPGTIYQVGDGACYGDGSI